MDRIQFLMEPPTASRRCLRSLTCASSPSESPLRALSARKNSFSMMQSLNAKLMAGFEMFYIPHQKEVHMCLGANYNHDIHSFYA